MTFKDKKRYVFPILVTLSLCLVAVSLGVVILTVIR